MKKKNQITTYYDGAGNYKTREEGDYKQIENKNKVILKHLLTLPFRTGGFSWQGRPRDHDEEK